MENYSGHMPIRTWAEDDRPREKLLLKGRHSLSHAELLAILLGSGTRERSAVDLAKALLQSANDNLSDLARMSLGDMLKIKGIGKVRAVTILAALELGRRRDSAESPVREKITSSQDAYRILKNLLGDRPYEEFWIILLNRANRVIRSCNISEGGISGTVVDPRKIFKLGLEHHASSLILGHNHPSGALQPSEADIRITKKIKESGEMLEIAVLDHLIIGDSGYYSFADEGCI